MNLTSFQRLGSARLVYPAKVTALVFCVCLAGMLRIDHLAETAFHDRLRARVVERAATLAALVDQQLNLHLRSLSALRAALQANPRLDPAGLQAIVTTLMRDSPALATVWVEPAAGQRMAFPACAAAPRADACGVHPSGVLVHQTLAAWGGITVLIDVNRLMQPARGLFQDREVALAVKGTRNGGVVLAGAATVFARAPVLSTIAYPGGQWIIGAAPQDGWERSRPYALWLRLFMACLTLVFSGMMFVLAERGVRNRMMLQQLKAGEQARRQWVADTSHELRTPLTILSTHLEAMSDGVIDTGRDNLAVLSSTVEGMQRLVTDLGQLARADAHADVLHLEEVDIHELCSEVMATFARQFESHGLRASLENELAHAVIIEGDYQRLQQVLGNLLSNCLRYTEAPGAVCLTLARSKGGISLSIDDSAPGVPDAALPKLFERFYRVDSSRSRACGGSGLGLAICQAIINDHGGSIEAAHSPLGGLRMVIQLPGRAASPADRSD